jgi:hypothetical protein
LFDGEVRKYLGLPLCSQFDGFWAPKSLPGIRNGCFYSFQTIKLKKNQNIDLKLYDGEFHKYFEPLFYPFQTKELKRNPNIELRLFDGKFCKYFGLSLWSCFDGFWALKSVPGITSLFGDRRGFMPLQLKTLPGIRNGYFYSFQTCHVLIISGLKSLPGTWNEEIFFVVGQKVDELFFFL